MGESLPVNKSRPIANNISQRRHDEWCAEPLDSAVPIDPSGLILRPGDSLLLAFKEPMSDKAWHDLKRRIDEALPDLAHVIVLENAVAVAAYRPES